MYELYDTSTCIIHQINALWTRSILLLQNICKYSMFKYLTNASIMRVRRILTYLISQYPSGVVGGVHLPRCREHSFKCCDISSTFQTPCCTIAVIKNEYHMKTRFSKWQLIIRLVFFGVIDGGKQKIHLLLTFIIGFAFRTLKPTQCFTFGFFSDNFLKFWLYFARMIFCTAWGRARMMCWFCLR